MINKIVQTECCKRLIAGDERYCPRCGWECRIELPSTETKLLSDILSWIKRAKKIEKNRADEAYNRALAVAPVAPEVTRGDDPGHRYTLPSLDGKHFQQIQFVKRCGDKYPGNQGSYAGTTTQHVLRALIDRTKYVDSQARHPANDVAIKAMRQALLAFEDRAAERHGMEIVGRHLEGIELIPFDLKNGHLTSYWKSVPSPEPVLATYQKAMTDNVNLGLYNGYTIQQWIDRAETAESKLRSHPPVAAAGEGGE